MDNPSDQSKEPNAGSGGPVNTSSTAPSELPTQTVPPSLPESGTEAKTSVDRSIPPSWRFSSDTPIEKETGHVITVSERTSSSKKATLKKIILIFLAISLVGASSTGAYYLYSYINNPLRILASAFKNFENSNSYTINTDLNPDFDLGEISGAVDYHKLEPAFSRAQINIKNIQKESGHDLVILSIFNSSDFFTQVSYSKAVLYETALKASFPELANLKTYQIIRPVFMGEKWLHLKVEKQEEGKAEGIQISEEKENELNQKFVESIVVRRHDKNFEKDGKKYHRIILGFDKDKLIDFINALKDLDLEVELKDINALVKIVQSVETWNLDLVTIMVDKDNNLHSISISLPEIPEDALQKGIEESSGVKDTISEYTGLWAKRITGLLEPEQGKNTVLVGNFTFTNYNNAPGAERPQDLVEEEEIEKAFQEDLPILTGMLFTILNIPQEIPDIPETFNSPLPNTNVLPHMTP